MNNKPICDLNTPIGEILESAASDGVLVESEGQTRYAVLPLDDELIDYLLERSPKFIEECRQIRERMHAGKSHSHEDVRKLLTADGSGSVT